MKLRKIILSTTATVVLGASMAFAASFTDLNNVSESYIKAIDDLTLKGVISGYPDETFKPANTVTRAEAAKMLVTAFNLKINDNTTFTVLKDAENSWAEEYINIAVSNGVVKGFEDGTFRPDNTITYGELTTILSRLLKLEVREQKSNEEWYAPYWDAALKAELFDDISTNDLVAVGNARRDNLALMIYNSLNYEEPKKEEAKQETPSKEDPKQESKPTNEPKENTSQEAKEDFQIDTNKIYFGTINTDKLIRGKDYIDVNNFNDEAFSLKVTSDKFTAEDGSVIFYKIRKSKSINELKILNISEVNDAYVIEKVDDEEDGVFKIKDLSNSFDISEDDYTFGENQVKLGKLTYIVLNIHKNKSGYYEFKDGEEVERFSIGFEEGDRIVIVPEKKLFVLIKGLEIDEEV